MRKSLVSCALVAGLLATIPTPKAHAFGIIDLLGSGRLNYVGQPQDPGEFAATVLCVILLPLCILEESDEGTGLLATDSLLDSGYDASEAAAIIEGQNAVVGYLKKNDLGVTPDGAMTVEELVARFSAMPGVTPEYLDFVVQNF